MFDGLMEDVFNTTALLPVAGVGEEPEYGGEEDEPIADGKFQFRFTACSN